ncbi:tetratricopeptide repeat protein [Maribacter sp. IgM3_T14_3]|uniref:tetratricopeptide repeat protein n=1 Tax=Maribacter sp. IgM3_T14_3 TaxID=3415140 RepID=UPI003C6EF882
MKSLILAATFIFTLSLTAQTPYEKGMNTAFELWKNQKNTEAVQLFERIADAETDNWLPPYYAGLIEIVSSFGLKDEALLTTKLTRAKDFLDNASAISKDNPEIMISYALLNTAYIAFDGAKYGMTLSGENIAIYQKAQALAPNNPRVLLGKTEWDMGTAKFFGKSITPYCEDVDRAIVLFNAEEQTVPYYPYSGLERAKEISANCKKETSPNE